MKTAIIIGGGIAGCSTAYALAKRGITVKLIERHHGLAQGASGNPVAMLYPKFNSGANVLSTIATEGFNYTLTLLKQLSTSHLMHDLCGQIQLAFNAREVEKQTALLAASNIEASNHNIQLLSASEASEKANLTLTTGGLYLPDAGWVKPTEFCEALIQSNYIEKILATAAISINRVDHNWQVTIEKEQRLEANIVVICNANDIQQFEQCKHIPITPVRGQVNFFTENNMCRELSTVICTDHYLSPAVDGLHSIGTSYASNDLNPSLSAADTQANLAALKEISPSLADNIALCQVTGRVAWRSATRDYIPLAGQLLAETLLRERPPRYNDKPSNLPWLEGLYMNAGHGSKGMITAPLCGELIANQVCNEPLVVAPLLAAKLNPSRFLLRALGLKKIAQELYPF